MSHEVFSLGVEIVTLGTGGANSRIRAWRNGVAVEEADHASFTQSQKPYVAIIALATTALFYVSRIEVRQTKGGSLLWAQNLDYPNWATMQASGWNSFGNTPDAFTGSAMGINGGAFSQGVYGEMTGVNPKYFEIQGCWFGAHESSHWGMLAPYWNGGSYGTGSFRVLHREVGDSVEIVDGFNSTEPTPSTATNEINLRVRQERTNTRFAQLEP